MKNPGRIAIIGAGPCGLGAAYRLQQLGYEQFTVFESGNEAGGLAGSVVDDRGFTWDCGCHVLYSRSDCFNAAMDSVLEGQWIDQPRDAQVWIGQRLVPYPLQYNVHRLPDRMRRDCVLGLARVATGAPPAPPANFHEWIVGEFGSGIAEHFMLPYNAKVWAHPLETLSVQWIAERVPRPDFLRVLENLLDAKDDAGWGPNARFRYPASGGIGAVWRAMAATIGAGRIWFSQKVTAIDPDRRRLTFQGGREETYDVLISTLPITRLVRLASLGAAAPHADDLRHSRVDVVGLGIRGSLPAMLAERKWIYFPDPALPFYRATVLSNFAPSNAPEGHWSLLAEVASSRHRPVNPETVVDDVTSAFQAEGFIPQDAAIVSRFHSVADPGYPTPTRGRDRAVDLLMQQLEAVDIYSRGRFGAWRYEIANQDHTFLQGAELVGRLLKGESEATFLSARS